jgi:BirA family biotin operon repressor/biotin-[acetyl-CoA-carboxylase] ligase
LAENGEKEGTVVVSERQKKGKGRQGRQWSSPKGGIYLSCILRPDIEPREVAKITLVSAVAVCTAIRDVTDARAMIKWPNDILLNKKKLCGILTEMKAEQDKVDFVIVGIGVNVDTPSSALPKTATSLHKETGSALKKVVLTKKILENLEYYLILFRKGHFNKIIDEWHDLSTTIGHHVRVHCHNEDIEGQAVDIDKDGALVVRLDSGIQRRVLSGDVTLAH